MNTGHEELECEDCHRKAKGTLRQQLQTSAKYLLGKQALSVDIGHENVKNEHCLACHRRPKDRHPVYRFLEPRFKDARNKIQPQYCNSCHQEHNGKRLTANPEYCEVCHGKLKLKKDPLDISHHKIVTEKR